VRKAAQGTAEWLTKQHGQNEGSLEQSATQTAGVCPRHLRVVLTSEQENLARAAERVQDDLSKAQEDASAAGETGGAKTIPADP